MKVGDTTTSSSQMALRTPRPSSTYASAKTSPISHYSMASQQFSPPTPPTAIHPALRPVSAFSRTSSSSSTSRTSTTGYSYDSMTTGREPRTQWTLGSDYSGMRPGVLPNSDYTTGLSYDEMREARAVGSTKKSEKTGWLKVCKEELKENLKENLKAMDRVFRS